jgi:hypothetical protein
MVSFLAMMRVYIIYASMSTKLLAMRARKHYTRSMMQKAPISVEAPTGAVDRTAEAARVRNSIIRLQAANLKGILSDLPFMPDRS